jgi:glyoxylase-like metal-dependent hydrolase (beta-lactamase superfamily II)
VLLTGDTVFASAVGRPDLERGDAGAEAGAHALFDSLHDKLFNRFDEMRFYPAHTSDPIGFDRQPLGGSIATVRQELGLLELDKPGFVERILESLQPKPPNHNGIIAVNEGKQDLGSIDPLDLEAGPNRCAAG